MNDSPQNASFPGLLAGHLAKLNHQLRHLLGGGGEPATGTEAGQAHAVIARLRVASALLASPDAGQGAEQAPLQRLGLVLGELVSGLDDAPGRLPVHLLPPMSRLADFLGEAFDRLDAGEDPGELCRDARWESILASFINAGTLLQALDEVEEQMQAWSRRFGEQDLSLSQEEALRRRWALLRDFGDTLFGLTEHPLAEPDGGSPPEAGLAGRRVMLLLDSPFRRSQLHERLREAGCAVEIAGNPAGMMARVNDPLPPQVLLCDNLEPSLHLTAVRRHLQALPPAERPPLVLVAVTGDAPAKLTDRAKHLGVQGTWAEPFRPADLAAALT